jgi:iron complex outermembrane receptor protein
VTSVSRRAERLSDAPASIYVITADDIRRAGANSLPEPCASRRTCSGAHQRERLRHQRPRLQQRDRQQAARPDRRRAVYTPLFSGVFWDANGVMLDDVERIEVISGPGATLWGANAVNGVINVITRPARDTRACS